jgi:hypothetical protein
MKFLGLLLSIFLITSLAPDPVTAQQKSWTITLAGYKMKPPVATGAAATVTLKLRNDTLTVSGSFRDLSDDYRSAHIYYGAKEATGNAIIALTSTLDESRRSGRFPPGKNKIALNPIQKAYLMDGDLYVSISSKEHPHGEIRGIIQ